MTKEEVIKALECCAAAKTKHCMKCPARDFEGENCIAFLAGEALALIQRLTLKQIGDEICKGFENGIKSPSAAQAAFGEEIAARFLKGIEEGTKTADVVEVVRCKDCIYSFMSISGETVLYCDMHPSDDHLELNKNYFCAYGERRPPNEQDDQKGD